MKEISLLEIKEYIKTIYVKENVTGRIYSARCNHIDGTAQMTVEINNSILNVENNFFTIEIGTDTQLFRDTGVTLEKVANVMCTYVVKDMKLTVENRRMHKRVRCCMDSYFRVLNNQYKCTVVNVSEGGALIKVFDDIGESVKVGRLSVPLEGKDMELDVIAIKAIRDIQDTKVHCKFTGVSPIEQKSLFKLVYKLQVNERLMVQRNS